MNFSALSDLIMLCFAFPLVLKVAEGNVLINPAHPETEEKESVLILLLTASS